MRTEKALKNMITSFLAYFLVFIAGILVRRLLLNSFDAELVGYDALISDIFSYISLADLGIDSLFTYRLYEAYANNDKKGLNKLLGLYKLMFVTLGTVVAVVCLIVFFLVPSLFASRITYLNYFRLMFVLYSISTLSTYFFGYWRSALKAAQLEHKAIIIETSMTFISLIFKIILLLTSKNYLMYLFISTGCTLAGRLVVQFISKKTLNFIVPEKASLTDFKNEGMLSESVQLLIIKVADTITWCSNNLFISILIDIKTSTLYSNYSLIVASIWTMISKIINPITATLADLLYKEEKDKTYVFYNTLSLGFLYVSTILLVCLFVCLQPTISFFFGDQYLLNISFVFLYAFQFYLTSRSDFINCFRSCFGEFEIEKKYAIISAIANILVAFILAKYFGINSIICGTIVSIIIVMHSRIVIVAKFYNKNVFSFWLTEIRFLLISITSLLIANYLCVYLPTGFIGLLLRAFVGLFVSIAIVTICSCKSEHFKNLFDLVKDTTSLVLKRSK